MYTAEFNQIVESRVKKTLDLLVNKAKEYAREDRLHNFKVAARLNGTTPTREAHGFLTKHIVSYLDLLNDIDAGKKVSSERVEEKIGDIITYFFLQEALITEYMDKHVSSEKILSENS